MGFLMPKTPAAPRALIPSATNGEAERQAELQEALMRRRRGAAADILTSPSGIPSRPVTPQLGGSAA